MGREEDVTRKQLEMEALGKLEQLQPSPGAGSWQELFGQKTPPKKIQRVVAAAPMSKPGAAVAVAGGKEAKWEERTYLKHKTSGCWALPLELHPEQTPSLPGRNSAGTGLGTWTQLPCSPRRAPG